MRIGLVIPNTPQKSETFLKSKIEILENIGHRVILFSNQNEHYNLYRVIQPPIISKNRIYQVFKMVFFCSVFFLKRPKILIRFLKLEKKDNIKFRTCWENLYINLHILNEDLDWLHFGFITMSIRRENVAQAMRIRMSISLRGYDICVYPLKYPDCYKRLWYKVDKVHSISQDLLNKAKKTGLKDDTLNVIIQPAINVDYFQIKQEKNKIISEKNTHFLTVARLHWKKGLEYTLEALALIKKIGIKFNYTVIGDGVELERLIFASHQLGLNNQVNFLGYVEHNDIKKYYSEADIYLQYSIQEGFCNSVLEAQAMGLITIVSNAEGLSENVLDGETGFVVKKMRSDYLAAKIQYVLGLSNKSINEIRENAISRVNKKFSLMEQEHKFLDFFKY